MTEGAPATWLDAPVDGILFDYGETLVRFTRPEPELRRAAERIVQALRAAGLAPPPPDALRRDILDRVDREASEHDRSGELVEIDLVAAARRAYLEQGLAVPDALLDDLLRIEQEAWWHGAGLVPDALPVLAALRAHGLRVGLCSNAPYRVASLHDQLRFVNVRDHLDSVTFSAEVGWRKPSRRIFEHALDALGTNADRTVMVGDSEANDVAGAHAAGMRAVLIRRSAVAASRVTMADAVVSSLTELEGRLGYVRL